MNLRNTKQKEIILEAIKETKIHPTSQQLISLVNKKDESIGQATIYRNIKKLKEEKQIIELETENGHHFDYNRKNHYHIYCKNCKKIIDIFKLESLKKVEKELKENNIDIDIENILFTGICEYCKGEKNEEVSL